jgi:hypothetical protein
MLLPVSVVQGRGLLTFPIDKLPKKGRRPMRVNPRPPEPDTTYVPGMTAFKT